MESLRSYHRLTPDNFSLKAVRGFTLVEMMVVMAIITVITGIMLTNQASFNKTLILANTAYDIALTLRSAETYGISSRGVIGIRGVGYGLHFDHSLPGTFTFFRDSSGSDCHVPPSGDSLAPDAKVGDCVYQPGERITDYNLGNEAIVSDFCAYTVGSWSCAEANALGSLDIIFIRPDPNPFITVSENGNVIGTKACLTISAPGATVSHYVSVAASGAIVVSTSPCI